MYLRTVLLVFGRNPIVHDEMISFDKDYIDQDQETNLMAKSIPDHAYPLLLIFHEISPSSVLSVSSTQR